jgi:hypothetical protein
MVTKFTEEVAKEIGEKLGIDWSKFDVEQFRIGMGVELEHGAVDSNTNVSDDDALTTGKIALAHLNEFPDYYTRLLEMEEVAEEFWEGKSEKHVTSEKTKELALKEGL